MTNTQRTILRVLAQTPTEYVAYWKAEQTAKDAGAFVTSRTRGALERAGWIATKFGEEDTSIGRLRPLLAGITRKGLDALIRFDRANYPGDGVAKWAATSIGMLAPQPSRVHLQSCIRETARHSRRA